MNNLKITFSKPTLVGNKYNRLRMIWFNGWPALLWFKSQSTTDASKKEKTFHVTVQN